MQCTNLTITDSSVDKQTDLDYYIPSGKSCVISVQTKLTDKNKNAYFMIAIDQDDQTQITHNISDVDVPRFYYKMNPYYKG